MKFFGLFPGILSIPLGGPLTGFPEIEELRIEFGGLIPQSLRNGMDPDYERNFPAQWWEYQDQGEQITHSNFFTQ